MILLARQAAAGLLSCLIAETQGRSSVLTFHGSVLMFRKSKCVFVNDWAWRPMGRGYGDGQRSSNQLRIVTKADIVA